MAQSLTISEYTDHHFIPTKRRNQENNESKQLIITNDTKIAFNVPIYNSLYFDCTNINTVNIDEHKEELGQLVATFATKSDQWIKKQTRNAERIKIIYDEKSPMFLQIVPCEVYQRLFYHCFTTDAHKKYPLNVREYADAKIVALRQKVWYKRSKRPFIIFESNYGIHKEKVPTLLLLLRICHRFIIHGVVNIDTECPPWIPHNDVNYYQCTTIKREYIDLTTETDEDNDITMNST